MTTTAESVLPFAYRAESADGRGFSGTIDAPDQAEATRMIESLGLRVLHLEPVPPLRARPLRGDEFIAFNQQLAQLTSAGLPVEKGLRLIAQDLGGRRLGRTAGAVAAELERGTPLPQAFEKFQSKFPPLYGRLIAAGVQANNLPGMLLNIGRHMELVHRIRAMLWRTLSYPLMVFIALLFIMAFLSMVVLPQFEAIFADFNIALPLVTQLLLTVGRGVPVVAIALLALVVGLPLLWRVFRLLNVDAAANDVAVLPMPLIGPVLRRNLAARWCDAVRIGVSAALDLPKSIELAAEATGSPKLSGDSRRLIEALETGRSLGTVDCLSLLPATVPVAMSLAIQQNSLPQTLQSLSEMYEQQAEHRLALIPAILNPLLLLFIALVVGFVILGLLAPLIALIQGVAG